MRTWADEFNNYRDACDYYGADTPESLASEDKCRAEDNWIAHQDQMEAIGGPVPYFPPNSLDLPF